MKMLRKTESTIGIRRNYVSLSVPRKILYHLRVFVEIIFATVVLKYIYIVSLTIDSRMVQMMQSFQIMSVFSGIVIMISSILSSRSYELFIHNFMLVHRCFQNEATYIKCTRKLQNVFVIIAALSCLSSTLIFAAYMCSLIEAKKLNLATFLITISDVVTEERFILMNATMHVYITMIRNVLQCLNNRISDFQVQYKNKEKGLCSDGPKSDDLLTIEQVKQWAIQFKCLMKCSRNLSVCIKVQVNSF